MPNITNSNVISSSAQIADGIIVNADVSASAAIALSKLSGVAASGANSDITSLSALSTPLSVAQGGTGKASISTGALMAGNGTGAPTEVALGTSGQVLTSNGAGLAPTFQASAVASFKAITATRDISLASGSQTIAHGLGRTPKIVFCQAYYSIGASFKPAIATGIYDGTTQVEGWTEGYADTGTVITGTDATNFLTVFRQNGTGATCTIAVDATNITLTWTKVGSQTGTIQMVFFVH